MAETTVAATPGSGDESTPKKKPVWNSLPSQTHTRDNGNTIESISISGISQPPEVARKVAEIIKKHGENTEAAQIEIDEYHEYLKTNPPADPVPVKQPEFVEMRRYLLAVASTVSGQFEHLSNDRLMDIAALSIGPVRDFETWRPITQLMRKPPA